MAQGQATQAQNAGWLERFGWLIPCILGVLVYVPAPFGELVWDDPLVLTKQIAAFDSLRSVFFPPENIFQWSQNYYRPMVVLTYLFDLWLYGDARVAGLHVSNVLFHVVTTLFVYLLARQLFTAIDNGAFGAVVAAVVFAVHPIHTESVSWITGRSDVVAAMFLLPAVWLAQLWRNTGRWWVLPVSALLYLLALLSKEVAIVALVVIPLMLWLAPMPVQSNAARTGAPAGRWAFGDRRTLMTAAGLWLLMLAMTVVYLVLRSAVATGYGTPVDLGWMNYAARLERSAAYYLVKVAVPWPQSNHAAWNLSPGFIATNLAFMLFISLAFTGAWLWRRHRDGLLLFVLFWFVATLLPSLSVVIRQISGTPLAERYLYLPSAGLAILLGYALIQPYWRKWTTAGTWAVVALVAVYSVSTIQRGIVWTSNLSLWTDTTSKVPTHGQPWNLLGITYMEREEYVNALAAFERAIEGENSAKGRSYAKRNIAVIYHYRNDLDRAESFYLEALEDQPDNSEAIHGLGVIHMTRAAEMEQGQAGSAVDTELDKAEARFRTTLTLNPFHAESRWGLASVLAHQGRRLEMQSRNDLAVARYREAEAEFDTLLARYPDFGSIVDVREKRTRVRNALRRLSNQ